MLITLVLSKIFSLFEKIILFVSFPHLKENIRVILHTFNDVFMGIFVFGLLNV